MTMYYEGSVHDGWPVTWLIRSDWTATTSQLSKKIIRACEFACGPSDARGGARSAAMEDIAGGGTLTVESSQWGVQVRAVGSNARARRRLLRGSSFAGASPWSAGFRMGFLRKDP